MQQHRWLCVLLLVASACEIEEGPIDWDGSLFEDSGAGRGEDAGDDDDAGTPRDAGRAGRGGAGGRAGAGAGGSAGSMLDGGIQVGNPGLAPGDVPRLLAEGYCGALEACVGPTLLRATFSGNDCVEYKTRQQADRQLHWLAGSIAAGNVTFRPEELETCKADMIKLGCNVISRRLPFSCERAIEGKLDPDQDCAIDLDCKGTAYCYRDSIGSCPGFCAPLLAAGSPCTDHAQCADGLICRGDRCVAPASQGDDCETSGDCPPGMLCQGTSGARTCQFNGDVYVGELDAPCDALGKLCKVGLVCRSESSMNTSGKCANTVERGATCRRAQPSQCPPAQYCKDANPNVATEAQPGVDGVCSDRATAGQSCDEIDCVAGTVCLEDAGGNFECRALKSAGAQCIGDDECYGGDCDDDANVCAVTVPECKL